MKPWKAAIFGPTNAPDHDDATPPDDALELEWVHGFRGFDTRRAALWLPGSGGRPAPRAVYPAAALVVVYDAAGHAQKFLAKHTDDVLGVAVHRGRQLVASAQCAYREGGRTRKPTLWVWEAAADVHHGPFVFTGVNQRQVYLLAFDRTGDLLCSVGDDDDHLLVLWDWRKGVALAHVPTHKERIFACRCSPYAPADATAATAAAPAASSCRREGVARVTGRRRWRRGALRGTTEGALKERAAAQLTAGFTSDGCAVLAAGGRCTSCGEDGKAGRRRRTRTAASTSSARGRAARCSRAARTARSGWSAALEPCARMPPHRRGAALPLLTPRADGRPPRLRADWDDPTAPSSSAPPAPSSSSSTRPRPQGQLLGTGHAPPKRGTMGAVASGGGGGAVEEADEELGAVRALATAAWLDVAATGGGDAVLGCGASVAAALLTSSLGAPISALDCARGCQDVGGGGGRRRRRRRWPTRRRTRRQTRRRRFGGGL